MSAEDADKNPARLPEISGISIKTKLREKSIDVSFSPKFHSADCWIYHPRAKFIADQMKPFLISLHTPYSIFYGKILSNLPFALFSICAILSPFVISTFISLFLIKKAVPHWQWLLPLSLIPYVIVICGLTLPKLYPPICFRFGVEKSRIETIENSRKWVIGTILLVIGVIATVTTILKNLHILP